MKQDCKSRRTFDDDQTWQRTLVVGLARQILLLQILGCYSIRAMLCSSIGCIFEETTPLEMNTTICGCCANEADDGLLQGPRSHSRPAFRPHAIPKPPYEPPSKPGWDFQSQPRSEAQSPQQYREAAPPLQSYQAVNRLAEAESAAQPREPPPQVYFQLERELESLKAELPYWMSPSSFVGEPICFEACGSNAHDCGAVAYSKDCCYAGNLFMAL